MALKRTEFFGRKSTDGTPILCFAPSTKLRIGVFFDGSGNDTSVADKYSNVFKLYLAYINDLDKTTGKFDPKFTKCDIPTASIYKRGVGTDKDAFFKDDPVGNGAGWGIKARIAGMFYDLREVIYAFHDTFGSLPEVVELDVFGFSRGAATARHFINLIAQEHFTLAPKRLMYDTTAEALLAGDLTNNINYQFNFVGIFDTVGSIGISGNDIELGYSLDLTSIKVKNKIVHMIAEDEYRANFDLTSALQKSNIDYPDDIATEDKIEEILCPGVHSDIGGGYTSKEEEQGLQNNDLARIYLHQMYQKGLENDVPFWPESEFKKKARRLTHEIWAIPDHVKKQYDTLMDYYSSYKGLRLAYKKYRQLALTLTAHQIMEHDNIEIDKLWETSSKIDSTVVPINRPALTEALNQALQKIRQLAGEEAEAFLNHGYRFYRTYVHRSCLPWNPTTGMWSQYKLYHGLDPETNQMVGTGFFHRQIFRTAYINFEIGNRSIHTTDYVTKPLLYPVIWALTGKVGLQAYEKFLRTVDYDKVIPIQFEDGDNGQ